MDTPGDSAPLRVRGIAVASPRANAFGTVQLACLPEGLEIVFSSVGGTSPGYAPGPLVRGVRVIVPYVQVHTIERDGALLHLEVDPSCTAYNRLSLVHLSTGLAPRPDEALDRRRAARESARIAATATWLPAVALAREVWAELSWAGIALVVVLAVAATLAAGEALARRIVLGGPDALDAREALLAELFVMGAAARLPARPAPAAIAGAQASAPRADADARRAVWTAAIAGFAAIVVLAIATVPGLVAPRAAVRAPVAAAAAATASAAPAPAPPPGPAACTCARADGLAWRSGVRALALLTAPHDPAGASRARRADVDVVAVNDGAAALRDVRVEVELLGRADASGKRPVLGTRGLFWAGDLEGGRSVKWRVDGFADEVRATSALSLPLGDADVAGADAFAALGGAHTRAARLHAAEMLAWHRDPRARALLESLRFDARADERARLGAIERATAPLFACEVRATRVEPKRVRLDACVANAGERATRSVAWQLGSGDDETAVASERIALPIEPGSAVRLAQTVDVDEQASFDATSSWLSLSDAGD